MALRRLYDLAMEEDSSEDENFLIRRPRRSRWIREREENFEKYDDVDFAQRFRLSKAATVEILDLIIDDIDFPNDNYFRDVFKNGESADKLLMLSGIGHSYYDSSQCEYGPILASITKKHTDSERPVLEVSGYSINGALDYHTRHQRK
ncbi:unnamed protein product [Callosobruchus maculatus]|uniref:Uncharacterized protein n=1 Tax=Callosobruchus maculatus TaxID=64391 RepID=A0A653C5Z6_CALMS|nr:unnamed protein product [Callosobruchus maculatus]